MGNHNSHQPPPPSVDVVRPPSRPSAPPSSRPLSELGPRGPSYHSPQNQVLPRELPSILKLRPVSMELSKYKPEYQGIFATENSDHLDDNKNEISVENNIDSSLTPDKPARPPPVANGHIPHETPLSPVTQLPDGQIQPPSKPTTSSTKSAPYRPSHRRQMSLGQEHTILEEPEESIESRVKLDPLMQSFPGATGPSLPVKNNFNLDYSYQLTYVQLAEHRRNKTIEELEKRTGKKLSDLSADLNEHVEKPMFVRDAASRASSRSTGSLGTGLSSKKKKAPPPPGQPPPPPPGSQQYSFHNEPPIDYDLESPRKPSQPPLLPRYTASPPVSRVAPSTNKSAPAPPPPPGSSPRKPVVNLSRSSSMSNGTPEIILRKTPEIKTDMKNPELSDGQVPWLLEIKNLSQARAARRQQSQEAAGTPEPVPTEEVKATNNECANENTNSIDKESDKPKLVFESSGKLFAENLNESNYKSKETKNASVERSDSVKNSTKPPSPKLSRYHSTTESERPAAPEIRRQISEPGKSSPVDPVRRLSSLLQHDIKTAANAKCLKLVKQTTPVLPKPKDPHTVFREQLQKACAERDERAKIEGTIDDKLKLNTSSSNLNISDEKNEEVVKYNTTPRAEKKEHEVKEAPNTLPKPPRYHKNVSMNKVSGINRNSRAEPEEKSRYARDQKAVSMSLDWTPEADLDSDDNLSDREVMTNRKGSSDGFKSTIIPNSMTDLKAKKKFKSKKNSKENSSVDEQAKKFGSVRKLKKTVNKSVRNAFGSISKASGKLLRKQRSEDFEAVDDTPKNWSMTASMDRPRGQSSMNGYEQKDDSDSNEDTYNPEREFPEVIFRQKSENESEDSSDSTYESEDKTPVRRAGVAYISSKGKLVLMDDEDEDEIVMKRKLKEKKLKKKSESVSQKLSKTDDLREMERRLEEEKRKKLEMELELHKRREAETRERIQRLEQAHLQQQLLYQQQQQQHLHQQPNIGLLGAPALPPPTSFQTYGALPDTAHTQTQAYANLFGQQLPQNGYQPNFGLYQTGSFLNGTVPGMTYDLNDYMRMLGQNPPTSQQMAYFLNSMTLAGQPFDRKSNPALYDVFNQQYPNGPFNYSGVDGNMKKTSFQNWASSPNISLASTVDTSVPLGDFVASYNGANNTKTDEDKANPRNPLYNSDDSDEGLSPRKSVARAYVKDFRKVPVRTESGKFMRKYASENLITETNPSSITTSVEMTQSSTTITQSDGLPQHKRSVSPTNSISTVDSAMSSPSVTLSTPSSPSRSLAAPPSPVMGSRSQNSTPGFRTVLDLSAPDGSMQIISTPREPMRL